MTIHSESVESLSSRPWKETKSPSRILIMRLHAIGDVAITLPYCAALRERFPDAQIDFLTTATCADLPRALTIFNNVRVFLHATNRSSRLFHTLSWSARVARQNYDIVIDLQRNWVSRSIRIASHPLAWAEFNRTAPRPAGDRTRDAFIAAGFSIDPVLRMPIATHLLERASQFLHSHGRDSSLKLIVLNPAGLLPTRNWPIQNYRLLAKHWLKHESVQFLLLGTDRMRQQASFLKNELGDSVINLVGTTSLAEAFAVLQYASGAVSEDSGLMHMAWVSGKPTVALFGSSRHDWSRPLGVHSQCLHSGDLECGACMSAICRYGDVHCLTRYTPEYVFETARRLFSSERKETAIA